MTSGTERSDQYVVGVDYGTLSGRAVVVRVSDGTELGSAVFPYPHGVMDRTLAATGERLLPDWALQVPSDYVDVLRNAVPEALATAAVHGEDVIGIGTDFTACAAVGSAMHAAVAAGAYPDTHAAAAAMGKVRRAVYVPDEGRARTFDALFAEYTTLHDYFGRARKGGHQGGGNDVMHRLRRIRREALP